MRVRRHELLAVLQASADELGRYCVDGVEVQAGIVQATNGRLLLRAESIDGEVAQGKRVVHRHDAEAAANSRAARDKGEVEIETSPSYEGVSFPDAGTIVPGDHEIVASITIQAALLQRLLDAARLIARVDASLDDEDVPYEIPRVTLEFTKGEDGKLNPKGRVRVKFGGGSTVVGVVMPMTAD